MVETSHVILGALLGAGGIGAALYLTGAFEEDEPDIFALPPPPPRPLLPPPPVIVPTLVATPAPVPAKPVGTPSPAVDREAIKAEVRAAMEAESKTKAAAAAKAAEEKRLTGRGWTRRTHRDVRTLNIKKGLPPPPANWNEQAYLNKHPDVKKAVAMGAMPSGYWHYMKHGKKEGRPLKGWNMRRPGYLSGIFANWDWRFD